MRCRIGFMLAIFVATLPRGAGATFDVAASCDEDRDCAPYPENPWCDPGGFCWSCGDDSECTAVDEMCIAGTCVLPCGEDLDCGAAEPTCHPDGHCVECIDSAGCLESEYCSLGFCIDDVCSAGETRCHHLGSAVIVCNASGSGWDELEACAEDCTVVDGAAQCAATASETAGSGTAGDPGGTTSGGETTGGGGTDDAGGGSGGTGEPADGNESASKRGCRIGPGPLGAWWLLLVPLSVRRRDFTARDRRQA
jgi:hypothetical protein